MQHPGRALITVFGLIYDIHIDDDGLVRQLVTAEDDPDEVIADNRLNRNVPVEIERAVCRLPSKAGVSTTCCRRARRSAWM